MKALSSFVILKDRGMERLVFTYDVIGEDGKILKSNQKANFVVLEDELELQEAIKTLESFVVEKMNSIEGE